LQVAAALCEALRFPDGGRDEGYARYDLAARLRVDAATSTRASIVAIVPRARRPRRTRPTARAIGAATIKRP